MKFKAIFDNQKRKLYEKKVIEKNVLKSLLLNSSIDEDLKKKLRYQLNNLPRNSCKTRIRNRCVLTQRSRSVYSKLKLSRIAFRKLASQGLLTGFYKSSW